MADDSTRPRLIGLIGLATRQTFEANSFVGDYADFVSWEDDRYGRLAEALRPLVPVIAATKKASEPEASAIVRIRIEPVFAILLDEFPRRIAVEEIEAGYVAPIETLDADVLEAIAGPSVAIGTVSGLYNKATGPLEEALRMTEVVREFIDRHARTLLALPSPEEILRKGAYGTSKRSAPAH